MEQLKLMALRDLAIEHLPRAQKTKAQSKLMSEDQYNYALYGATLHLGTGASATEVAASGLLRSVLGLLIDWEEENKPTTKQRRLLEEQVISEAATFSTLTSSPIPWLPATPTEPVATSPEREPEPKPLPVQPSKRLPQEGELLSTRQAADLLGITEQYMRVWASEDSGPIRPIKGGTRNKWSATDVLRLMREGWTSTRRKPKLD